jgi:hypothetical protein
VTQHVKRARLSLVPDAAEAERRIDDWFRRGYVMFSDRFTKSTHLRPAEEPPPAKRAAAG